MARKSTLYCSFCHCEKSRREVYADRHQYIWCEDCGATFDALTTAAERQAFFDRAAPKPTVRRKRVPRTQPRIHHSTRRVWIKDREGNFRHDHLPISILLNEQGRYTLVYADPVTGEDMTWRTKLGSESISFHAAKAKATTLSRQYQKASEGMLHGSIIH